MFAQRLLKDVPCVLIEIGVLACVTRVLFPLLCLDTAATLIDITSITRGGTSGKGVTYSPRSTLTEPQQHGEADLTLTPNRDSSRADGNNAFAMYKGKWQLIMCLFWLNVISQLFGPSVFPATLMYLLYLLYLLLA